MYWNNAFGQGAVHPIPPDQILFTAFFPRLQMSNGDAFSGREKPSGGGAGGTRERTLRVGSRALQAMLSQTFAFHGAQSPISTLGRKGIGAGMAQSHWGTPRAAAATAVLKRSKSKAGGRERSTSWILGKREQSVPSMAQTALPATGDNSRFQIEHRARPAFTMKLQNGQLHPPAACKGFVAFFSALNRMAEPLPWTSPTLQLLFHTFDGLMLAKRQCTYENNFFFPLHQKSVIAKPAQHLNPISIQAAGSGGEVPFDWALSWKHQHNVKATVLTD